MLADDRIGRIGQAELLKARASGFPGQIGHFGQREKAVQDDLFEGRAVQLRGDGLGEQTRSAGGDRDRGLLKRQVCEEVDFGDAAPCISARNCQESIDFPAASSCACSV